LGEVGLLCQHNQIPVNKRSLLLFVVFIFLTGKSSSQSFLINQPRLQIEGNQLLIFYDIITEKEPDQFYIWVEIEKANGEKIKAKSLSGDIGENQKSGNDKKIIWSPEQDSIYIDEEIFVSVKAEKYTKSFNKGSAMLKSALLPGWGQTKISQGKPWWLTGVAFYGTLAGGYLYNQKYHRSYDSYKLQEDRDLRAELYDKTQKQQNIFTGMIYSAAALWAANVLWVAITPNTYKPLQHTILSFNSSPTAFNRGLLVSLRFDF